MEYRKIHFCPNDCILYRKEFEGLHKCLRCGVSRYKVKDNDGDDDDMKRGPPVKVLWYLPIIPRLRRFFCQCWWCKELDMACKWKKIWWVVTTCCRFTTINNRICMCHTCAVPSTTALVCPISVPIFSHFAHCEHFLTRLLKNHDGMLYFLLQLYNRNCIFNTFLSQLHLSRFRNHACKTYTTTIKYLFSTNYIITFNFLI